MIRALAFAAVVLVSGSAFAQVSDFEAFEAARAHYEAHEYEEAVAGFELLVGGETPRLTSRPLILESYKFLGASYLFLQRRADAETQFERLLAVDPNYLMDPVVMPREVIEVWSEVQTRVRAELARQEEERRRQEEERRRQEAEQLARQQELLLRLRQLAEQETVERVNSRWIASLPFGIGQFQNGQRGRGLAFAVSESALLLASITTGILRNRDSSIQDSLFDASASQRQTLRIVNWASTGALFATALIGIIEAHVNFRATIRETRRRELPPDLREGLELVLTPTSVYLAF